TARALTTPSSRGCGLATDQKAVRTRGPGRVVLGSKPQLATAKELVRWVQLVSWAGDEAAAQLTDSTYWTMTLPIIHGCGVQLYVHVPAVSKVTEAVPPPPEMSPVSQLPSAAVAVWIVAPSLRQVRVVPTGTDTTCGV